MTAPCPFAQCPASSSDSLTGIPIPAADRECSQKPSRPRRYRMWKNEYPRPHGYANKEARFTMAKDKKYDPKTGDIVEVEWYDTHATEIMKTPFCS